jgi:hypothetical protein
MSNGTIVPASVFSSFPQVDVLSELVIGTNSYSPPDTNPQDIFIWLVVVDLTTLTVVANDISKDGSTVPSDISQYAGNPRFFLYAISNAAWAQVAPQGALYTLLQQAGSGPQLARLEQIYAQIGTGFLGGFSYILAATLADDQQTGFEELSMSGFTIMTMGFLPVTVGGKTIYAPIQTIGG